MEPKGKKKKWEILFIYIILLTRAFPPKNKLSLMFFKKLSKFIQTLLSLNQTRVIDRTLSQTLFQAPLPFYKVWVAMCGRTCACACEIHSGKCGVCACVRLFFGPAMCDHTFAHFRTLFGTKLPENATF